MVVRERKIIPAARAGTIYITQQQQVPICCRYCGRVKRESSRYWFLTVGLRYRSVTSFPSSRRNSGSRKLMRSFSLQPHSGLMSHGAGDDETGAGK